MISIHDEMMREELLHYLPPQNQVLLPQNLTFLQTHEISNIGLINTLFTNFPSFNELVLPNPSPTSCLSTSNSTSDDADEHQHQQQNRAIIDERRQRRMISNRESARRSRMRKQRHLDELWSQVLRLKSENQQLIKKLNHLSESHDKSLRENLRLKEEASHLRQMLSELRIGTIKDLDHHHHHHHHQPS